MKDKNIDLVAAFKFFFSLSDWKSRVVMFAVPVIIGIILYVLMIVPFVGCLFMIITPIFFLLFSTYLDGGKVALARSIKEGKGATEVYADFGDRVVDGLKVLLLRFFYNLPVMLLVIVGYVFLVGSSFLGTALLSSSVSTTSSRYSSLSTRANLEPGAFLAVFLPIIAFYGLIFLAYALVIFINLFLIPVVLKKVVNKDPYSETFNVIKVVKQLKKDFWNILIMVSGEMGSALLFIMPYFLSLILVFLCVGIFIVPVVLAVYVTYQYHLQGHLYGQYAALAD